MTVLKSALDTGSDLFAKNTEAMQAVVGDLREKAAQIELGAARARERHLSRGKLLPRDRIDTLLDEGSPFLEFSQFAGWEMYEDVIPAGAS